MQYAHACFRPLRQPSDNRCRAPGRWRRTATARCLSWPWSLAVPAPRAAPPHTRSARIAVRPAGCCPGAARFASLACAPSRCWLGLRGTAGAAPKHTFASVLRTTLPDRLPALCLLRAGDIEDSCECDHYCPDHPEVWDRGCAVPKAGQNTDFLCPAGYIKCPNCCTNVCVCVCWAVSRTAASCLPFSSSA